MMGIPVNDPAYIYGDNQPNPIRGVHIMLTLRLNAYVFITVTPTFIVNHELPK